MKKLMLPGNPEVCHLFKANYLPRLFSQGGISTSALVNLQLPRFHLTLQAWKLGLLAHQEQICFSEQSHINHAQGDLLVHKPECYLGQLFSSNTRYSLYGHITKSYSLWNAAGQGMNQMFSGIRLSEWNDSSSNHLHLGALWTPKTR